MTPDGHGEDGKCRPGGLLGSGVPPNANRIHFGGIAVHELGHWIDPRAFVVDWLRSHSNGNCSEATDLTSYLPHTYALVDKLEAGDQWVNGGNGAYVGDIAIFS
ncbi:MAG TPA: hypothetical protein VFP56_10090 [Candidatus Limnocylindrales bacterium]|nr:hypothetical protein [Candidatus Limnocylindrales bacterium]